MNLLLTDERLIIEYLKAQRDAYLSIVAQIENILPDEFPMRTSKLRQLYREGRIIIVPSGNGKESEKV